MNRNETTTLWISLCAALVAVFLLYNYSQEKKNEYDKKYGSMTRVVVASKDISEMETLDETMLDHKNIPEDYVAPGGATEFDSIIGKVTSSPIKKGEQILDNKLLTPGPDAGIALQIAPGKRAVTLPVDEIRGVGKLLKPGDRIDIVGALDIGKGAGARREVNVLLQDIPILATGLNVVNNIPRIFDVDNGKNPVQISLIGDTKFSNITIEVDPAKAQDLIFILSTQPGNLYITLRNPNDRSLLRLPSSTIESVTGRPTIIDSNALQPTSAPSFKLPSAPSGR